MAWLWLLLQAVRIAQPDRLPQPDPAPFPATFEVALSAHAVERARVFARPGLDTPVIGVVEAGHGFPIHEVRADRPCPGGVFLRIASARFVCSVHFRPSAAFPLRAPVVPVDDTLKPALAWRRATTPTPAWTSRGERQGGRPSLMLPRNAHLLHRKRFASVGGELMVHTIKDYLVAAADLEPASPSEFAGRLTPVPGDLRWAVAYHYPSVHLLGPGGVGRRRLPDKTWVRLAGDAPVAQGGRRYLKLEDGWLLPERYARVFEVGEPPPGVGPQERWIEVNMTSQTLVAYEGARPVFRTLISSGRIGTDTTPGLYRIYFKRALQDVSRRRPGGWDYFFEGVPFVQFFHGVFAFHTAMWHHAFGSAHSMGCVETSLRDGAFLFGWTLPRVPDGYLALTDTAGEPGTLVRIVKFTGHKVPTRFHPRELTPPE